MNRAIEWFARNPVAANLLLLVIVVLGLSTISGIKLEVFPEFSLDRLTVTVQYLGASPEEVEEAINVRVEEAIQGIEGVKKIMSLANEGFGVVTVELELGSDAREVLDDIKSRVDAIDTFPEQSEKPIYAEMTNRRQVIDLAVAGDADERSLRRLAEQVRDELSALPEITIVELTNARPYEISIEVSERTLRRHRLTFDDVARAVRNSSLDLPAGSVKTSGGEILLRTKGQAYRGSEFEEIVLLTRGDGTRLLLRDVAVVVDGFAETDQFALFDGKPAVLLQVFRTGDQSSLQVAGAVLRYAEEAQARMPEGIVLATWQNAAKILQDRLSLLVRTGTQGFILVFLILALFLHFRLAMWVSVGIPISFLGALWLMPFFDVSINLLSLFAFIVVLGIVVDDAIVVGENIHRHQHRTGKGLEGSIGGVQEVAIPVTFAVLTTVAAFMPLVSVPGSIGKIMRVIPLIVIPTLVFSLIESQLILPAHLRHYQAVKREPRWFWSRWWRRFQGGFADRVERFIEGVYRPALAWALEWRYLTVAAGVATLLITLGVVMAGHVRFVFFPSVESEYLSAAVTLPQGTPVAITRRAVAQLESRALQLQREVNGAADGGEIFRHVQSALGGHPYRQAQSRNAGGIGERYAGGHLGEVTIELAPAEEREGGTEELLVRWRELVGSIPDAVELDFSASLFSPGDDINVQLTGPDIAELRQVADELEERLAGFAGVDEIADSFREGKREVKLALKPAAVTYGLRLVDVARQVRQAFYGEEAQRIQRGRDDIKVMIRYPEEERRSLGDLERMRIRTREGVEVPFSEVADVDLGRGFATIKRVDRRRAINVTASVDESQATAEEVIGALRDSVLPGILSQHPAVLYTFEGQKAEQRDTVAGLQRGFVVALFAIFALLAVPLRSYVQPLIIMLAIPFGLVGAVWGHVIMRMDLTILSMFGIVALTGVVVNDSLVLVDFVNRKLRDGATLGDAVREAGVARFRPIILTSLTTFGGLTPLLLERSMQARFLIPMAVSLAFGVMFATFITLALVPAGYLILEDVRSLPGRLRGRSLSAPSTGDQPSSS